MASKSIICFLIVFVGVHCNDKGFDAVLDRIMKKKELSSNIAPDTFVSGGRPAQVGQFPWMARLSISQRYTSYMCAGTLISKTHVLTAGHCVEDVDNAHRVKVYLGDYSIRSFPNDCVQGKCTKNLRVYPDKIIKHAEYNSGTIENDIALLRLQGEAPVGGAIQVIPLPPFDIDDPAYDGIDVLVTGWGTTENGDTSDILLTTELKMISRERCLRMESDVPSGHLCAGDPHGRDTCPGDSGGPLVMVYHGKHYLSGVVSYGPSVRCGTAQAGYYTNVFKYMNWIKTKMEL